jgi:hypothetical protein
MYSDINKLSGSSDFISNKMLGIKPQLPNPQTITLFLEPQASHTYSARFRTTEENNGKLSESFTFLAVRYVTIRRKTKPCAILITQFLRLILFSFSKRLTIMRQLLNTTTTVFFFFTEWLWEIWKTRVKKTHTFQKCWKLLHYILTEAAFHLNNLPVIQNEKKCVPGKHKNASLNTGSCGSQFTHYSSYLTDWWHFSPTLLQTSFARKKKFGHLVAFCGFRAWMKAIACMQKQVVQVVTCGYTRYHVSRVSYVTCPHVCVVTKFKSGISVTCFALWCVYARC